MNTQDLAGKWAVVTGASSGLGADFAEILAARGCSLVLVARRRERLEELRAKLLVHRVAIEVLPLDLSQRETPWELYAFVTERKLSIDFLVNNAGLGKTGHFLESSWEYDENILNVNVRAMHHLMKLFLTEMVARGRGRILNVASVAGFWPIGNFAAYAASKAYVLHLTEGVHTELEGTGVSVCALCPGVTRTEFFKEDEGGGGLAARLTTMESRPVAEEGIALMLRGDRPFVITGWFNKLMVLFGLSLPRAWVPKLGRFM